MIEKARTLLFELAVYYPPTPAGLRDLVADPRWRSVFPTSRVLGDDAIALEVVDVLKLEREQR